LHVIPCGHTPPVYRTRQFAAFHVGRNAFGAKPERRSRYA
jgi:hypothetical protein